MMWCRAPWVQHVGESTVLYEAQWLEKRRKGQESYILHDLCCCWMAGGLVAAQPTKSVGCCWNISRPPRSYWCVSQGSTKQGFLSTLDLFLVLQYNSGCLARLKQCMHAPSNMDNFINTPNRDLVVDDPQRAGRNRLISDSIPWFQWGCEKQRSRF